MMGLNRALLCGHVLWHKAAHHPVVPREKEEKMEENTCELREYL